MIERIYPIPPYDFPKMLRRPLSRPSKLVHVADDSYTRALRLPTRAVPVRVVWAGTVWKPVLEVHLPDDLTDVERTVCVDTVRFMCSADRDLAGFVDQLSADPAWASLLADLQGVRPMLDANLFESMVKTIIGQQLNVQFAATLVDRFVTLGRETLDWGGGSLPVFPSPEQVASWSYEQLRALAFSQRKAEYVIDFARAVVNGELDLDSLWQLPDHEVMRTLTAMRGIGRWTVECLLLFGMGRPDVFPAGDLGVQNAAQRLYGLAERPSEGQLREMAESWRPWRTYATYYLWQSLIGQTQS